MVSARAMGSYELALKHADRVSGRRAFCEVP